MGRKMTEQKYKAIKLMLKGGATLQEICEFYPIGRETLRRIKITENFEEYSKLNLAYEQSRTKNRKPDEPEQLPNQMTIDDLKPDSETVALMKEQNDLLRRLLNDVSFIVSELTRKGA